MKFRVSSTALSTRLSTLSKVINSKNTMQIFDCFLFEIADGKLNITASDSENSMTSSIVLDECDGDGKFAVVASTILNAVRELPEQPLAFDVAMETFSIQVVYQNGMFNFTGQNADEYPQPQVISGESTTLTMDSSVLLNNINRSVFATAQETLRPVMNGIYFDLTNEWLAFVASDGHKLVRNRNYTIKSETPASFILPSKPALLLKNVLSKDGGDVVITFNYNTAVISFADGTLICRLIEGRYPNYNSVIPQDNPNKVTIDRRSMISAVRHVLPFASDSSELIRLQFEIGKVNVSSEDIDFSTSAEENITCEYAGMPMSIGFKGSVLVEILNNIESDEVIIELADPSRAGIIVPPEQPENEYIMMIIMPLLLND